MQQLILIAISFHRTAYFNKKNNMVTAQALSTAHYNSDSDMGNIWCK